jgi:hypothetical protein
MDVFTNSSFFCTTLRPPSPLPHPDNTSTSYCPIPAGPFALSASIPCGSSHELTTLNTQLRAVDPFGNQLLCIEVSTTPLRPRRLRSPYGNAAIILWFTVCLTISYWIVVGLARIVAAWGRGASRSGDRWWTKVRSVGYILTSAISGERLATSPALLRFGMFLFLPARHNGQLC